MNGARRESSGQVRNEAAARRPSRPPRARGRLFHVLSVPLLTAALGALAIGQAGAVVANAVGFVLFLAAGHLMRRGTSAEGHSRSASLGRFLPAIPLQDLSGALVAMATAFTAYFAVGHGVAMSILFGSVAAAGFHLFYGFVPLVRRRAPEPATPAADRAVAALKEAEARIRDIEQASLAIGNPELKARLWRIALQARRILGHIAERPGAMRQARRFLTTYLEGAQQVTRGYARTHTLADERAPALEQNFRNVLVTIEDVFVEQEKHLLESDLMDLDVQIEVLAKQLKQEGIL